MMQKASSRAVTVFGHLFSVLNMKELVATFNQGKALEEAFTVTVKSSKRFV